MDSEEIHNQKRKQKRFSLKLLATGLAVTILSTTWSLYSYESLSNNIILAVFNLFINPFFVVSLVAILNGAVGLARMGASPDLVRLTMKQSTSALLLLIGILIWFLFEQLLGGSEGEYSLYSLAVMPFAMTYVIVAIVLAFSYSIGGKGRK